VLDEQQPPSRPQHAPYLRERHALVRNRAQHERRDDGVEASIGKRQCFGPRLRYLDRDAGRAQLPAQLPPHERIRLRDDYVRGLPVVGEVRAGPAAYLKHGAGGFGE
jgi:hypothetical protein